MILVKEDIMGPTAERDVQQNVTTILVTNGRVIVSDVALVVKEITVLKVKFGN